MLQLATATCAPMGTDFALVEREDFCSNENDWACWNSGSLQRMIDVRYIEAVARAPLGTV